MRKALFLFALLAICSVTSTMAQSMNDLAGRWLGPNNFYVLEVNGEEVRWKNENSQVWTDLQHVSGFDYKDDDGYKYIFNPYKGTVQVINPDNENDVKSAKKENFTKPDGKTPKDMSASSPAATGDYRGAHGFLLTYRGSALAPIGIGIGGIGKSFGMYFGFRTSNLTPPSGSFDNFDSDDKKEFGGADVNYVYVYNGYTVDTRGAMTLGYIYPFKPFISFFLGLGLGWSRQFDYYDVYDPATGDIMDPNDYYGTLDMAPQMYGINRDSEIYGLELEFGAMAHYKIFNATAGLSFVNMKKPDFVIGIGFLF